MVFFTALVINTNPWCQCHFEGEGIFLQQAKIILKSYTSVYKTLAGLEINFFNHLQKLPSAPKSTRLNEFTTC